MALKFLKMDETAQKLGVSVDELNQLRERHEISGYRDGPNWKFKEEDVQRLAEQLASRKAESPADEEDFDLPLSDEGSGEVVLVSDQVLGESDPGTSSTIIGRPGEQNPEESDIRLLTPDDEQAAAAGSSDVKLVADTDSSGRDSDVKLVAEAPGEQDSAVAEIEPDAPTDLTVPSLGPSDSDVGIGTEASGAEPADLGSDIVLGAEGAEPSLDDALSLGDDDLIVADDESKESALASGDEDEEFVLGGTGGGSDVTLPSADSGISLADPADSGLSLEGPLELGPSDEASLELDLGSQEVVSIDEDADSAEVVEVKSEDDFELTPVAEVVAADEGSSGSQVIELDEESSFGEEDLLGAGQTTGILEEEAVAKPRPAAVADVGLEPSAVAAVAEPKYTTLNVLSLGICTLFLFICATMVFDLVRNMWIWDSPYQVNSAVMDLVMGLFGG